VMVVLRTERRMLCECFLAHALMRIVEYAYADPQTALDRERFGRSA
jgi:hypothetical protein